MRRWLIESWAAFIIERLALNMEWWSWNGDLVILSTHICHSRHVNYAFQSQKNAFKTDFYGGWLHPYLVCDGPLTPSPPATTTEEEERSRLGNITEGSCVPFSCRLMEESCNYCRLSKLPAVKKMVYFWPENELWVTHCNSSLPPHPPLRTHLVPRPDKPPLRNTCVGGGGVLEYWSFADYNILSVSGNEHVHAWKRRN